MKLLLKLGKGLRTFLRNVLIMNKVNGLCNIKMSLLNKYYKECVELIETIVTNSYQWLALRVNTTKKVEGVHEVGESTTLATQIAILTNIQMNIVAAYAPINATLITMVRVTTNDEACVYCAIWHVYVECLDNLII